MNDLPHRDAFLRALADLDEVLEDNITRAQVMKKRIARIEQGRSAGRSYRDIVSSEDSPHVVQHISASRQALDEAGARVRRTEALALHDEGMTMEQIAAKFGVTRQRLSGLLRDARADAS